MEVKDPKTIKVSGEAKRRLLIAAARESMADQELATRILMGSLSETGELVPKLTTNEITLGTLKNGSAIDSELSEYVECFGYRYRAEVRARRPERPRDRSTRIANGLGLFALVVGLIVSAVSLLLFLAWLSSFVGILRIR